MVIKPLEPVWGFPDRCTYTHYTYHEDKDSKTYVVKVKKYDSGTPEEFLKWRLILNEQMKNNGYAGKYDMIMNLAQAMLAGRSLEAFFTERGSQEAKNRIRKAKDQTLHPPQPNL
jgi:hypothetical protein